MTIGTGSSSSLLITRNTAILGGRGSARSLAHTKAVAQPLILATSTAASYSALPQLAGRAGLRPLILSGLRGGIRSRFGPITRRAFSTGPSSSSSSSSSSSGRGKGGISELFKLLEDSLPSGAGDALAYPWQHGGRGRKTAKLFFTLMGAGALLMVFPPWCVVPAGHVGLLDFFGDVSDITLAPGFHLKVRTLCIQSCTAPISLKESLTHAPDPLASAGQVRAVLHQDAPSRDQRCGTLA